MSAIRENLLKITERIEKAAQRVGRDPKEIKLVACCKTVESARIKEAIEAGASILGENYVQEAQKKIEEIGRPACTERFGEGRPVAWHFVGHLPSNKGEDAVRLFDMIHSLDRFELAEELDRRAEKEGRTMNAMIEVNLSGETTKFGAEEARAFDIARRVLTLSHLSLVGLMTMPPYFDDPRLSRPYYIRLRELKEKMIREGIPLRELSMGMSNDFEIAIEEGATFVRVGTG